MDSSAFQHMEVKKQSSPFSSLFSMASSSDCNVKRKYQELGFDDLDLVESQIIKPGDRSGGESPSPFGMKGSKKLKTEGNLETVLPRKEATPSSPRSLKSSCHSEPEVEFQESSTVDKSNYNDFEGILSLSNLVNLPQADKSSASTTPGFSLPERLSQKIDFSTKSKLKRWFKIMDSANVSSEAVEKYLQSKAIKSEKHHVKTFTQAHKRALFHLEKSLFNKETSRIPKDISKEVNLTSYIESQVKGPKLSLKQYIDI